MTQWLEYPQNVPQVETPVLIAGLTADKTSLVQFATFHINAENKHQWQVLGEAGGFTITHFLLIPQLPRIHHVLTLAVN